jgi:hypothetical protein
MQSMVAELANELGKDPKDFLLEMIGPPRIVDPRKTVTSELWNYGDPWDTYPVDTARTRRVVEIAAKQAGWGRKLPKGHGMGIAVQRSFLTYVATVVEVAVDGTGKFLIHGLWDGVRAASGEVRVSAVAGGERMIPLTEDALQAVLNLRRRAGEYAPVEPSHYVFASFQTKFSFHGKRFVQVTIKNFDPTRPLGSWRTAWRTLTRQASLPGLRFHDLRHQAITELAAERTAPVSASSPTMTKFSSCSDSNCSLAASIPTAIGKSKLGPSFFTSAGARLIVVRPIGNLKPELFRAVLTRSRDSLTAASGNPTITTIVSPQPEFTSTSIG